MRIARLVLSTSLISLLTIVFGTSSRAWAASGCELDDLDLGPPASITRNSEVVPTLALPGVAALRMGVDVLLPIPDLPLADLIVLGRSDTLSIVMLRFAGPSSPRVSINFMVDSTLKLGSDQFGVTPRQVLTDYLSAPSRPNCSDTLGLAYHALGESALVVSSQKDIKEMDVVWRDAPLRIAFAREHGESPRDRLALVEIAGLQRRLIAVDWSDSAIPDMDLAGFVTGNWTPRSAPRRDLELLSDAISVGSYEGMLAVASEIAVPCITKFRNERLSCSAALAMIHHDESVGHSQSAETLRD